MTYYSCMQYEAISSFNAYFSVRNACGGVEGWQESCSQVLRQCEQLSPIPTQGTVQLEENTQYYDSFPLNHLILYE